MFNPNEEIQIIGVDLGDNPDFQSQYIAYKGFTELNKKLELKNRYKEQVKENIKLKKQRLDYQLNVLKSKGDE